MARPIPKDFLLATATSSFQIEGALQADGRTPSIWDNFPTETGDSGARACEHYRRYRQDVAMMSEMGVQAYRFSISWPRVHPQADGKLNRAGIDFYSRLVDELLAHDIEPWVTLYHWDLPMWMHERGGWESREVIDVFAAYTRHCAEALGDRVRYWATINEPWCIAREGYQKGVHAPGLQVDRERYLSIVHNLLVAHGTSVKTLREVDKDFQVGIVLNPWIPMPLSCHEEDLKAADAAWSEELEWWFDPIYKGHYPKAEAERWVEDMPCCHPGDMEVIGQALDFLGLNLYFPYFICHDPEGDSFRRCEDELDLPRSDMDWPIYPPFLHYGIKRIHEIYHPGPIYLTENGCAMPDTLDSRGRVHDLGRKEYLRAHLNQLLDLVEEGVPVKGYFAWSLMDNFEWQHGYSKRFGLIRIDFETQERIWKTSAQWYQQVIAERLLHHHYHESLC